MKYIVDIQNEDYEEASTVIKYLTESAEFKFYDGNPNFKVSVKLLESIDEDKLEELANKNCTLNTFYPSIEYEENDEKYAAFSMNDMQDAFKLGARKVMECNNNFYI